MSYATVAKLDQQAMMTQMTNVRGIHHAMTWHRKTLAQEGATCSSCDRILGPKNLVFDLDVRFNLSATFPEKKQLPSLTFCMFCMQTPLESVNRSLMMVDMTAINFVIFHQDLAGMKVATKDWRKIQLVPFIGFDMSREKVFFFGLDSNNGLASLQTVDIMGDTEQLLTLTNKMLEIVQMRPPWRTARILTSLRAWTRGKPEKV